MQEVTSEAGGERSRIVLGLLESVERDGAQSQRRLAAELGIALGLVNAYLKRCVNKGLLKVRQVPRRRYAYYLTPQGFAEKSRLTVDYLMSSLSFFRQAKADCRAVFEVARSSGFGGIVLAGRSDLAEIAAICAIECGIEIVSVVDAGSSPSRFIGIPVVASFDEVALPFDGVMVTDLVDARGSFDRAVARFGVDRVLIPDLLHVRASAESARP